MKKKPGPIILILCLCWQCCLYGQTTVELTGTVKSSQGAVQAVEITFLTLQDEFQGNCISGPDGKFRSQYKTQIGKTIKIRLSSTGYDVYERTVTVDKTGNLGEFMLRRKDTHDQWLY